MGFLQENVINAIFREAKIWNFRRHRMRRNFNVHLYAIHDHRKWNTGLNNFFFKKGENLIKNNFSFKDWHALSNFIKHLSLINWFTLKNTQCYIFRIYNNILWVEVKMRLFLKYKIYCLVFVVDFQWLTSKVSRCFLQCTTENKNISTAIQRHKYL